MKKFVLLVFVLNLLFILTACGKTKGESQLCLAPTKSQDICMLGERVLFDLQGHLFCLDPGRVDWTLQPIEGDAGNVGWDVSLCEASDDGLAYLIEKENNMLLTIE